MSFRVSVIKKNQVLAWLLTLILGVAGILNYTNDPRKNFEVEVTGKMEDGLGEAVLVDSPHLVSNVDEYMDRLQEEKEVKVAEEYFAQSRIDRNRQFAEQMEVYEKMLSNDSLQEDQKRIAQDEIKRINANRNAISVAENLIKLKGVGEVVILQNGESINVVVAEENLTEAKVAQIQNIIEHEMGAKVENIHINNL